MFAIRALHALATACLFGLPFCQAAIAEGFDHDGLARQVLERHVRPGYANLAEAAAGMSAALGRTCASHLPAERILVEKTFDRLVEAWGRVEHIAFGPVMDANRSEQILFWPDRRGLGARQVASVLASRDPAVTDAKALAGKSVAMRGIGALDLVLFGDARATPAEEVRQHRCSYARAIAANLLATTRDIAEDWQKPDGFARLWLEPGPANQAFASRAETTFTLAKTLDRGLERVREERLAGPLGLNKQRRATAAPLAASGRGMRLAVANIDGLLSLYVAGGFEKALVASAAADDKDGIRGRARQVAAELRRARDQLAKLTAVRNPFGEARYTGSIVAVGFPLKNARAEASALMTSVAGVAAGFNSSDGD